MSEAQPGKISRRAVIAGAAVGTVAVASGIGLGNYWLGRQKHPSRALGKKVIIIGVDGMDPRLCERLMQAGQMPNLARMRASGGFRSLGTSTPPQSPVAWANFINGAGPGSHGIFDFIHRHPETQCTPFYSAAETIAGEGHWEVGDHKLQLDFWPFNHKLGRTVLKRQGTPFWDYLDAAGVPSTFYDLPSNYPPSPSRHGHHRCLCGMGTPDMLGTYGTYQFFSEDGPSETAEVEGGLLSWLSFQNDTARAHIIGPEDSMRKQTRPTSVEFDVHRDRAAGAVVIDVQGQRVVLEAGQWSRWVKLSFALSTPAFLPGQSAAGICRFYLQSVTPQVRLYVSPINMDPAAPAQQISEPPSFAQDISNHVGPFYTTGFQEDYKARMNGVFDDDEYARQANLVLEERFALLERAVDDYEDGLMFFYFSSSDLQSHMFWWDSDAKHPIRNDSDAQKCFGLVKQLYQRLDRVVGELLDRYGSRATVIVMSDHGFANFGRQFNLNSWLRNWGYLGPPECTSVLKDVDWSQSVAYGLGINGLYLNMKGRERDGIVEPGEMRETLLAELIARLEAVTDEQGERVIRGVYRSDQIYKGDATALAPDLIVGYARNYRAAWATTLGDCSDEILFDNDMAWSADHCADALEVPGVLFCNQPIDAESPSLVDLAPTILSLYGLPAGPQMVGRSLFRA